MMRFFEPLKDKNKLFSFLLFISAVIVAVIGFVLLPDKIFVELFSKSAYPETGKVLFLSVGLVVVALPTVMCFYAENVKKWLATEAVVSIAYVGCIVYNLIVL